MTSGSNGENADGLTTDTPHALMKVRTAPAGPDGDTSMKMTNAHTPHDDDFCTQDEVKASGLGPRPEGVEDSDLGSD